MLKDLVKNNVLGNPIRLGIMLYLLPRGKALFIEIQHVLELTPGNLDSHLRTLEKNEYVAVKKVIRDRPRTMIYLTDKGANETKKYVLKLKNALKIEGEEFTSP